MIRTQNLRFAHFLNFDLLNSCATHNNWAAIWDSPRAGRKLGQNRASKPRKTARKRGIAPRARAILTASRRVASGMSIASPGLLVNEDCSPPDSPGTSSKPSRSGSLAQSSRRRITRLARTCFRSGPVRTGMTDDAETQDTDAQPISMPAWRKVRRERLNPFHRRAAVVARSVCRNSRCQTKELQCPI